MALRRLRGGDVSLAPIDERRGWANLGYWSHLDKQEQDYATEAARLVVRHGFEELRLHRISATIIASNEPSKRVVEKLGFVHQSGVGRYCGAPERSQEVSSSGQVLRETRVLPK